MHYRRSTKYKSLIMSNSTIPSNCHVMAKPSSSICNLDCKYCFYLEKEKLYPERNKNWQMDDETLEQFVKQQIAAQSGPEVHFAWQGGEPTLMGIDFYKKAIEFVNKYANGKTVHHAFQTNGILLNDKWCEFFKEHNFLIGISIDGPKEMHDAYRVSRSGKGTHSKVMKGVRMLQKHDIPFNTLTVVNDLNSQHPREVYHFLKKIGSTFMQFIPLVECEATNVGENELKLVHPDQPVEAKVTDWSVRSLQFGKFLSEIFDDWIKKDVGQIFVQTFDSTLANWLGQPGAVCIFSETCGNALALEANGDLYSCDHYVYPEYKLGNIHEIDIVDLNTSEKAIQFGQDKKERLTPDCKECKFQFTCHGGCPKHRFDMSPKQFPHHNYLCKGYYHFFEHTAPYMATMRKLLLENRSAVEIMDLINSSKN